MGCDIIYVIREVVGMATKRRMHLTLGARDHIVLTENVFRNRNHDEIMMRTNYFTSSEVYGVLDILNSFVSEDDEMCIHPLDQRDDEYTNKAIVYRNKMNSFESNTGTECKVYWDICEGVNCFEVYRQKDKTTISKVCIMRMYSSNKGISYDEMEKILKFLFCIDLGVNKVNW